MTSSAFNAGVREWCARRVLALPGLWLEAPLEMQPGEGSIDLPLRPSRMARLLMLVTVAGVLSYSVQLALALHPVASACVVLLPAGCAVLHLKLRPHRDAPGRLVLAMDGTLLVGTTGALRPVQLHRESLRLGQWLVLRLDGAGAAPLHLVLGPDNVDGAELAALHRRLRSLAHSTNQPAGLLR